MNLIEKFEVKTVKVADLKEWEINPRTHSEKGLLDVKNSIDKFGVIALMYCDKDLTIIGGHARKKVLVELGVEEVKCYVAKKKLPEKDFKALALLSNQVYSRFNQEEVNDMVDAFELLDMGFDSSEIDFDDDVDVEDDEMENTAKKEAMFKLRLKFNTEDEREFFEGFFMELKERFPEEATNSIRFIKYLEEEL